MAKFRDEIEVFKDRITEMVEAGEYSKDGPYLNSYKSHYVFVYGSLKSTFSRSKMLEKTSRRVGTAVSAQDRFIMFKNDMVKSPYPVLAIREGNLNSGYVRGEIWEVPSEIMFSLDHVEANGTLYYRTKEHFYCDSDENTYQCWIYIGKDHLTQYGFNGKIPLIPPIINARDNLTKTYVYTTKDEEMNCNAM